MQGFYPLDRDHYWHLTGGEIVRTIKTVLAVNVYRLSNLLLAGGIGTVRGFEYGAIGPKAIYQTGCSNGTSSTQNGNNMYKCHSKDIVGGNAMTLASIELIVPTPFVVEKNQTFSRTFIR